MNGQGVNKHFGDKLYFDLEKENLWLIVMKQ